MPSKYKDCVQPFLAEIASMVEKGASQEEIAKKLHITKSTLSLYLKRGREGEEPYSELSDCFARAAVVPDDNVEAALYKLACGYTVDLKKTFKLKHCVFDPKTGRKVKEYEELVTGVDQTHVPANVEAQKFWLANRRRETWAYKPEAEVEDGDDGEGRGVVLMPEVVPNEQ